MKPDHDITKLPKWAQAEIRRLRANEKHHLERLGHGPEGSDTFASPFSDAPTPLGEGTLVEFRFGEGWGERFHARLEGERLIVSGGSSIAVLPQASNVVEVAVTRS